MLTALLGERFVIGAVLPTNIHEKAAAKPVFPKKSGLCP
jgi:hypothetical protein